MTYRARNDGWVSVVPHIFLLTLTPMQVVCHGEVFPISPTWVFSVRTGIGEYNRETLERLPGAGPNGWSPATPPV